MTMPAIGTTAIGSSGTTPAPRTRASTGATPAAIASAVHGRLAQVPARRADVTAAMPNISSTNKPVSGPDRRTAVITSDTRASCTTARTAAIRTSRPRPSPPARTTAVPATASRTSTATRAGPKVIAASFTPPMVPSDGAAELAARLGDGLLGDDDPVDDDPAAQLAGTGVPGGDAVELGAADRADPGERGRPRRGDLRVLGQHRAGAGVGDVLGAVRAEQFVDDGVAHGGDGGRHDRRGDRLHLGRPGSRPRHDERRHREGRGEHTQDDHDAAGRPGA